MPRDLFGDVTRPSISVGNRKWYTVPVSLLTHSAIVFAIVAVPLLATDVLPKPWEPMGGIIIDLVPPTPPPPPSRRIEKVNPPADPNAAPRDVPEGISPEKPPDLDASFQDTSSPGFVGGADIETIIVEPPPPPPVRQAPIPVGGRIRAPQRTREVAPVYPPLAQAARVQGIVIVEATIGADGQVVNARILRSVHSLLDQAALDAVRQWQYTPTLLNGVPVPVIMTVTVSFTLSR
jgi:protein TonB